MTRRDYRPPNLFVIGAPKCGTTALHSALSRSASVFMTAVKEPAYFSNEVEYELGDVHYMKTYFTGSVGFPVRGEATPWYLYSSRARNRITRFLGEWSDEQSPARFLVVVRDPVARAQSMYLDQVRQGYERRSFPAAIAEELRTLDQRKPTSRLAMRYAWGGLFARHIEPWIEEWGPALHVLSFDDIVERPADVWVDVERFVGVSLGPEQLTGLDDHDRNTAAPARLPALQRTINRMVEVDWPLKDALRSAVPRWVQRTTLQRASHWNRRAAPPVGPEPSTEGLRDPETLAALVDFFEQDQRALHELTRR